MSPPGGMMGGMGGGGRGGARAGLGPGSARGGQRWAGERGDGAAVLATGSVYLVGDLLGRLAGSGSLSRTQASTRGAGR